jgi:hypothetical protein
VQEDERNGPDGHRDGRDDAQSLNHGLPFGLAKHLWFDPAPRNAGTLLGNRCVRVRHVVFVPQTGQ